MQKTRLVKRRSLDLAEATSLIGGVFVSRPDPGLPAFESGGHFELLSRVAKSSDFCSEEV